jgi:hypothetical protein
VDKKTTLDRYFGSLFRGLWREDALAEGGGHQPVAP